MTQLLFTIEVMRKNGRDCLNKTILIADDNNDIIQRLRAKLSILEPFNWDIKTIWGVGYKFEVKHV